MYNTGMSKGISKFQLALAVAKGKRVELEQLQEACRGASQMQFQTTIEYRIHKLKLEIKEIEGLIPNERI